MSYKVVIFDLDGTLLDTLEDLGEAVNVALQKHGYPVHRLEEFRGMVGHGVRNLVKNALPDHLKENDAVVDACLADFKEYYTAHIADRTHPYEGIPELVGKLHAAGVKLAIASNKFQEGTEFLADRFFPGIPFVAVLGNREGFPLKPDPKIVREVLRRADAGRESAVMVGDSATDMNTARNGGIGGIAVNWGYRSLAGTPGLTVAMSVPELEQLLLK